MIMFVVQGANSWGCVTWGKKEVEGCCGVRATEVSQQVGAVGRRGVVWLGALETVHALSDREGRGGSSRTMPQFLT